ncbi:MAG TPA: hypothetical protein VMJ75_24100 [Candidatus Acidoferrales bacterium]|nr:hypothetical protein [Candidatus Acidoferrales bacterium]
MDSSSSASARIANREAVEGYRAGKFPNGSVIVRETRSALDVMMKDDRLYQETVGWGFETFDSKYARLAEKDRAQCMAVTPSRRTTTWFSALRLEAGAGTPGLRTGPYPDER